MIVPHMMITYDLSGVTTGPDMKLNTPQPHSKSHPINQLVLDGWTHEEEYPPLATRYLETKVQQPILPGTASTL